MRDARLYGGIACFDAVFGGRVVGRANDARTQEDGSEGDLRNAKTAVVQSWSLWVALAA